MAGGRHLGAFLLEHGGWLLRRNHGLERLLVQGGVDGVVVHLGGHVVRILALRDGGSGEGLTLYRSLLKSGIIQE